MRKPTYALNLACLILLAVPAAAEEAFFDSAGVKIHYTVQGEGEPVLLIHGYTANGNMWAMAGIVGKLANDYRVITMDCRGHGKSDKPHDPAKYGIEMVRDVVRLLDHLKIERCHVVGYSMGGFITLKLLATDPERVISAVPAGFGWIECDRAAARWKKAAESLESGGGLGQFLVDRDGEPVLTEEQIAAMDAMIQAMNDAKALAAAARSFAQVCVTEAELRANKVPALSLIGGDDHLKPDVDRLTGVMGNHHVVVIEGANHMQAGMRPEFLQHIEGFLAKHSKPASAGE